MVCIMNYMRDPACKERRPFGAGTITQDSDGAYMYINNSTGRINVVVGDVRPGILFYDYTTDGGKHFTPSVGDGSAAWANMSLIKTDQISENVRRTYYTVREAGKFYVWVPAGDQITLHRVANLSAAGYEDILSLSLSDLPYAPYFDSSSLPLPV